MNCSRRDFLRVAWSLTAGVAVPPALHGCLRDSDGTPNTEETFVAPHVMASVDGRLDVTMRVAYLDTVLDGRRVTLRNLFGTIPAPTLSVNAGDTLRIRLVNQLPPNAPSSEPVTHLRYPNNTNLHTHGLHVNPGLVAPGVYGDYVMDGPGQGVAPGEQRQHEYAIPADHPPGAYWYHPHMHGSTAMQLGSGMAGALLVRGAIDRVPEIAAAHERVFMFQAPVSDANGRLESFTQVVDDPANEPPFLVNGVRRPRILMRRGEVQNWHFINASIFRFLNLALDAHSLHLYSFDGNNRNAPKAIGPIVPDDTGAQEGVVLAAGNRASVLVKAAEPGTYYLRTLKFLLGGGGGASLAEASEYIPFQSSRALRQIVTLGSVEEWTIHSTNPLRHPFHIHVNPCYVIKVNGQPIEPYWADTIALPRSGSLAAPTSVTFRTRFLDFKGTFVMHCHMAAHEDMGMMQAVEIV